MRSDTPSSARSQRLWWTGAAATFVLVVGVVVYVALYRSPALDGGLVARILAEAVDRATSGRYALTLDSADVRFSSGTVALYGGALAPVDSLPPLSRTRFEVRFDSVLFSGFDLWAVFRKRLPDRGAVRVMRPDVHLTLAPPEPAGEGPTADDVLLDLSRRLHGLRLDSVGVHDLLLSVTLAPSVWSDTVRHVDLTASEIRVDSTRSPLASAFPFSRDVRLYIAPHVRPVSDSLYELRLGAVRGSTAERRLVLDSLRYTPTLSDRALLRRIGHRAGRYDIRAGATEVRGISWPDLLRRRRLALRGVTVASLAVDYFNDLRWPPGPARPKTLPHEWARNLGTVFHIDTVRVEDGRIDFSRFAPDGSRRARLAFTRFRASAYRLTNDTDSTAFEDPAVLEAQAHLANAGLLSATFSMDLRAPEFNLDVSGRLERMPLSPLNAMLVPGEGLEIRSGRVDRVGFRFAVRRGVASGRLDAEYEDLRIREVNKESGRANLRRRVRSFLLNRFMLHSDNIAREGRPPRYGEIAFRYEPDQPFLRFLWLSVRSGVFSITGLDR